MGSVFFLVSYNCRQMKLFSRQLLDFKNLIHLKEIPVNPSAFMAILTKTSDAHILNIPII